MTTDSPSDPVARALACLIPLAPDKARSAHVRQRCQARMRHTRPVRMLVPALLTGLCMLYLSALVLDVLRLLR